jgi:hypothetical protein
MDSALGWVAGTGLLALLAGCAQGSVEGAATAESNWPHTATSTVPPVNPNARATFDACEWIPESALVETGVDVSEPLDDWDEDLNSRWHMCSWKTRDDLTWQGYPYFITVMSAPEVPEQMRQNYLLTKFREEALDGRQVLLAERSDIPEEKCLYIFPVPEGSAIVSVGLSGIAAALSDGVIQPACEIARPHAQDLAAHFPR